MTSQIQRLMNSPALPLPAAASTRSPAQVCRHLLVALADLKTRLQRKFELAYPGHSQVIRRAVAEAEQLAWQTPFPHLLLPDLAEVRVSELVAAPARAFSRAA